MSKLNGNNLEEEKNLPQASDGTGEVSTSEGVLVTTRVMDVLNQLKNEMKIRKALLDESPIEEDDNNPFKGYLYKFERDVNDLMTSDKPTASAHSKNSNGDDGDRDSEVNTEPLRKQLNEVNLAQSTNAATEQKKSETTNKRKRSRDDANGLSSDIKLPEAVIPNDERGYEGPTTEKARTKDSIDSTQDQKPTVQREATTEPKNPSQKSWWEKLWEKFVSFVKDSYNYIINVLNPNGTSSINPTETDVVPGKRVDNNAGNSGPKIPPAKANAPNDILLPKARAPGGRNPSTQDMSVKADVGAIRTRSNPWL
ncbi:MAG: hypothetical protein EB127_08265 [Alphaproteobacteria bacterium]|nr:hypothetical protein [Alphaproteobacteria bacterium]